MLTGPKWPRITWQPSSTNFRHGTSLLRLHGYFGPVYVLQVSKNDDEEHIFLKRNLALLEKFDTF